MSPERFMEGQDKYICFEKLDFQKLSKSTNKDKKICEICLLLNNKERRSTLTNWNRKRIRSMQGSPWKHDLLNYSKWSDFFPPFFQASGGDICSNVPPWIRPWYHHLARLFVYQFVIKIILNLKNTLSQLII